MVAPPEPSPVLERHVEPTRRRQLWWWALAGTAAANAALTVAVATRPSSGDFAVSVTVHEAPPAPVVIAAAPPAVAPPSLAAAPVAAPVAAPSPPAPTSARAPFADLGPCPAPHTGTPARAVSAPTGDPLAGVATSPGDSRLVAAWSHEHLYVSRDGGRSWDRVLDGAGRVVDATFDCHGRVLALRRVGGLGMRDGVHESWRPVDGVVLSLARLAAADGEVVDDRDADHGPDPYLPRLIGGGPAVAVVGAGRGTDDDPAHVAAVTGDAGRSWRRVHLSYWEGTVARGEWTGDTLRLAVPWTDCMVEGITLVSVTPAGTRTVAIDEYSSELAVAGSALLAGPYTCDRDGDLGDTALCAWRDGGWRPLALPPLDPDDESASLLLDGPTDVLLRGERLYPVTPRGIGRRSRPWADGWRPLATDRTGRVWGLDPSGTLVRS